MNQADVSRLVSRLKIRVNPKPRRLRNPDGPEGRLNKMRQTVLGLIKYERIELNSNTAEEARGYAERLISDAIRLGDKDPSMMETADYWLEEKQMVHKLFKVLVPRFENSTASFTKVYRAPGRFYPTSDTRTVIELRGHPFPPLTKDLSNNRNLLHNVLLDAAKREFRKQQYEKIVKGSAAVESPSPVETPAREANSGPLTVEKPVKPTEEPTTGS
uniref:Large ribosomal subunit protein bL17m n=2 Tax=Lygus hesperus TaxID=30085 RepID=A0A146LZ32_LYGHE